MKNKNKYHNAYKLYVSRHKLDMFLDESLWPKNIIFRRFVISKYIYETDNAVNDMSAMTATSATRDTCATNV